MKYTSLLCIITICLSSFILYAQEDRGVEVVDLKSGQSIVGKVISFTETQIEISLAKGGSVSYKLSDITPYSLYNLKLARIDKSSAPAHMELGAFAAEHELYPIAIMEFNRAKSLNPSLSVEIDKKLASFASQDAKQLYEEGLELVKEGMYKNAIKKFSLVRSRYAVSDYDALAQAEIEKTAALLRKQDQNKADKLTEKQQKLERELEEKKQRKFASSVDKGTEFIKRGIALANAGLDKEANNNMSGAAQDWKNAEAHLLKGMLQLASLKNTATSKESKKSLELKQKEIDTTLLRVYNYLGNLGLSQYNIPESRKWINKAMQMNPNDQMATQLKLLLTEMMIREHERIRTRGRPTE